MSQALNPSIHCRTALSCGEGFAGMAEDSMGKTGGKHPDDRSH